MTTEERDDEARRFLDAIFSGGERALVQWGSRLQSGSLPERFDPPRQATVIRDEKPTRLGSRAVVFRLDGERRYRVCRREFARPF